MTLQDPAVLPTQYQQFIHLSRYARWDYENERRETWAETVNRYFNFFQEHLQEQCNYTLENGELEEMKQGVLSLYQEGMKQVVLGNTTINEISKLSHFGAME